MLGLKLKGKIILPTIGITALLAVVLVAFAIVQFSSYTERLIDERMDVNANILRARFADVGADTNLAAAGAAADPGIVQAIQERDTKKW